MDCTYNRPSRRRRHPSAAHTSPPNVLPTQQHTGTSGGSSTSPATLTSQESNNGAFHHGYGHGIGILGPSPDPTGAYGAAREGRRDDLHDIGWRSFALTSFKAIEAHIDLYLDMVYPLFPLFHGPTLRERVLKREYLTDHGFFASVMAACALTAARVRDGAIGDRRMHADGPEKISEIFFTAAQQSIGSDFIKAQGLGAMRACAFLAITAVQYGSIPLMHEYLGKYATLRAMKTCHDERHWPRDISVVEREERRRIYWAMYNFDIYTAVVFDGLMWSQEAHSNVKYPSEVNDEDLTAEEPPSKDDGNWLHGWWVPTIGEVRNLKYSLTSLPVALAGISPPTCTACWSTL